MQDQTILIPTATGAAKVRTWRDAKGSTQATLHILQGAYGEEGVHFPASDVGLNQINTRGLYEALKAVYEPQEAAHA